LVSTELYFCLSLTDPKLSHIQKQFYFLQL
jgi:hypothetical protein